MVPQTMFSRQGCACWLVSSGTVLTFHQATMVFMLAPNHRFQLQCRAVGKMPYGCSFMAQGFVKIWLPSRAVGEINSALWARNFLL